MPSGVRSVPWEEIRPTERVPEVVEPAAKLPGTVASLDEGEDEQAAQLPGTVASLDEGAEEPAGKLPGTVGSLAAEAEEPAAELPGTVASLVVTMLSIPPRRLGKEASVAERVSSMVVKCVGLKVEKRPIRWLALKTGTPLRET